MQALSYEEGIIGPMHAVRVFYPGAPAAWPGNAGNVDRTMIVSFKFNPSAITSGSEDSTMQSWFDNAPRDRDIYWVYWHEPEDDIEGGAFTAADYRAAWTHLAGLAEAGEQPAPARDARPDAVDVVPRTPAATGRTTTPATA